MKRQLSSTIGDDRKMKKVKEEENDEKCAEIGSFDDNMVFEVLKHVDAKTLAMAGCVNKQWNKTAQDERLWELICTKQWANTGCGEQQLRSVVLALGGFRRLHSLYLLPLSKPQTSSNSSSSPSSSSAAATSAWGPIPQVIRSKPLPRLGKDEEVGEIEEQVVRVEEEEIHHKAQHEQRQDLQAFGQRGAREGINSANLRRYWRRSGAAAPLSQLLAQKLAQKGEKCADHKGVAAHLRRYLRSCASGAHPTSPCTIKHHSGRVLGDLLAVFEP